MIRVVALLLLSLVVTSGTVKSQPNNLESVHSPIGSNVLERGGIGVPPFRPQDWHYRLTGGFGLNAALLTDAPQAFLLIGGVQHNHQYLTAGFVTSSSTNFAPPRRNYLEADVLYGYAINGNDVGYFGKRANQFFASASIGLGYVEYTTRYRYGRRFQPFDSTLAQQPNTFEWTVGIPIQIQTSYAIDRFVAVAATLFGNLNTKHISAGGTIGLQIGYF